MIVDSWIELRNFDRVNANQQMFEPIFELVGVDIFRDGLLDL